MSFRKAALDGLNRIANRAGVHVMPKYEYEAMRLTWRGPEWESPTIPKDAADYLSVSNPRLQELRRSYDGHPAASHTQWDESQLLQTLNLAEFRGENHYLYQVRWSPRPEEYMMSAYYAQETDRLGVFGKLIEDGLFGAYCLEFKNRYMVSRDLLDSINEMNALSRFLGFDRDDSLKVLDIGAGYGRLAHRMTEGLPNVHVTCTDAVPISTFLSEFYIKFRDAKRARVIPLREVEDTLGGASFDVVCNIHSFSECQTAVIDWWLGILNRVNTSNLLIVPNREDLFLSTEKDGSHLDFSFLLDKHGWRLKHSEPIYSQSEVAQKYGLYPKFKFYLFTR